MARELHTLLLLATACAACPRVDEGGVPAPEATGGRIPAPPYDGPPRDTSNARPGPRCDYAERYLGVDEAFPRFPVPGNLMTPNEIAANVAGRYVGTVSWEDVDVDPPDDITIDIEVDAEHVKLRYITNEPPDPPFHCDAPALLVPLTVTALLGGVKATFRGSLWTEYAAYAVIGRVPVEFASLFAASAQDSYDMSVRLSLQGGPIDGALRFEDPGPPRFAGSFVAQRPATRGPAPN